VSTAATPEDSSTAGQQGRRVGGANKFSHLLRKQAVSGEAGTEPPHHHRSSGTSEDARGELAQSQGAPAQRQGTPAQRQGTLAPLQEERKRRLKKAASHDYVHI